MRLCNLPQVEVFIDWWHSISWLSYPSDLSLVKIKKDYVVSQIQSMYSCLGLTCDLVGSMKNEVPEHALLASSICDGNSDLKSLAGYRYLAEQEIIDQASLIDIDIILFFR